MTKNAVPYERYARQTRLPGFGEAAQQRLWQSRVLVIGAGGLGCPALQYLCGAGVGTLGIVDDDTIALSNLHRQPLFSTADIGLPKAVQAAAKLNALNPDIHIVAYNERLTTKNALSLIAAYDVVVDGSDNFSTRYLVNDACVLLDKPLVYGAVSQFEGQVAVFNGVDKTGARSANYRDIFPTPPVPGSVLNCAEAGVLGVLPGIIGTMQANETIKLLTHIGKPLINALFTYNALTNSTYEMELTARTGTRYLLPATAEAFEQTNYDGACGIDVPGLEIDPVTLHEWRLRADVAIIDVRQPGELPTPNFPHVQIPLPALMQQAQTIHQDTIVVFCQSGKRSLQAAALLSEHYGSTKKIFSLSGGILHWQQSNPTLTNHAGTKA